MESIVFFALANISALISALGVIFSVEILFHEGVRLFERAVINLPTSLALLLLSFLTSEVANYFYDKAVML